MSLQIFYDPSPYSYYTNLDQISGRICLHLSSDTAISAIIVKLEGESRSRLLRTVNTYGRTRENQRTRMEIEVHKLLYKTAQVFPDSALNSQTQGSAQYTLPAGNYEYPFSFKIPINNDCIANSHPLAKLNKMGFGMEIRDTNRHIKQTLPPTFKGFPGLAEIRYFVKVTVEWPQFYKANLRGMSEFKFLPIEPPRPFDNDQETFARRTLQFAKRFNVPEKTGLFSKSKASLNTNTDADPPSMVVDVRLPQPAIITCSQHLPLRILIKKTNNASEQVYLQMLQIELVSYSQIRARELHRDEASTWLVMSKANMRIPIGKPEDPAQTEWQVDPSLWNSLPLPNTLPPSFDTCNISRRYELDVRVGLGHGTPGGPHPEILVFPMRMQVQLFSGIAPPPALLEAIANTSGPTIPVSVAPPYTAGKADSKPSTTATPQLGHPPPFNSVPQSGAGMPPPSIAGDAPPSYEDAMADSVGPASGPRSEYQPQGEATRQQGHGSDEKASASLWNQNG